MRFVSSVGTFLREHAVGLAYALWGGVLFVVFFVAYAPYDLLLSRRLAPMGYRLESRAQHFRLPLGTRLEDVSVTMLNGATDKPILRSKEVSLRPTIVGFPLPRLGLALNALLYDGQLDATLSRRSHRLLVTFDFTSLRLPPVEQFLTSGVRLRGVISGSGEFFIAPEEVQDAEGHATLNGHSLALRFGTGLLSLTFATARASLKLNRRVLLVENFVGNGPELKVSAHGRIQLGPTLASSTADVTFLLHPTPRGRARLEALLQLLPHPPGKQPYRLKGSLAAPSVT